MAADRRPEAAGGTRAGFKGWEMTAAVAEATMQGMVAGRSG